MKPSVSTPFIAAGLPLPPSYGILSFKVFIIRNPEKVAYVPWHGHPLPILICVLTHNLVSFSHCIIIVLTDSNTVPLLDTKENICFICLSPLMCSICYFHQIWLHWALSLRTFVSHLASVTFLTWVSTSLVTPFQSSVLSWFKWKKYWLFRG